jgi:cellobiose phosphorylase
MINPVNRRRTPTGAATYKVEPYVVSADVYALAPHTGRGGWSWYTGSAGWTYRLYVESLLGVIREADRLRFAPCLPAGWTECSVRYRFGATTYAISLRQAPRADGRAATTVMLDDVVQPDSSVALVDDGVEHRVVVDIA